MIGWLLLAAGLALLPGPRREGDAGRRSREGPALSPRTLERVAAAAAGGAALLLGGWPVGLAAAAVLAPATAWTVARLARRARARPDPGLPLALDLAGAALRAGRPVSAALDAAAPCAGPAAGAALARVSRLLALGAGPADAWRPAADLPDLAAVAALARRSSASGLRLAAAFEQAAAELRDRAVADGRARAHRAGALAVAPLGLCFLPAFVCLGIVPVVVGIAREVVIGP